MKIHYLLGAFIISMAILTGCTNNTGYVGHANRDLLQETWMTKVNLDPSRWTRNADIWFFTGNPNQAERYASNAPSDKAMSIMAVKVPQFSRIKVNGCFQVQIIGDQDHNSLFILGTNAAIRQTSVQIEGNTLCITQTKEGNASITSLNNVIVRVGVRNLRSLHVAGSAKVQGRNIISDKLMIHSSNADSILLNGNMNLVKVDNTGTGTISIIGARTPNLSINAKGNGTVNVAGQVGIRYVNHIGDGVVSIVGADSNSLVVHTGGNGLTTIAGYVNLKKIIAADGSCVYIYWVDSRNVYIIGRDHARIGIAGAAANIDINLTGLSRFEGRYLRGGNLYVQTHDYAHANVTADRKLFASAGDQSSIYFFGSPNIASRNITDSGSILHVGASAPLWMPPMMMRCTSHPCRAYK
ncbi:MAG: hypothetical protein ACD_45C00063G0001 [uncultured bacterium]|nr:MAG: hypothetical protein ACD_45C00063G0001 [uncultured bacterium]